MGLVIATDIGAEAESIAVCLCLPRHGRPGIGTSCLIVVTLIAPGPVLVALLQFLGEWTDLLTALLFPPRQVRTSGLTMGADQ
jgi:hypothetical protein